jgi:HK97 family phage prohead protease
MRYSQNLGGFVEQIAHGAFDDVLARTGTNIQGLVNHDPNWLLATTDSGTMTLAAELVGLAYEMQLDPGDPDAVRAMSKVSTGKMRGSSFSFSLPPGGDEWTLTEQGFPLRTIRTFSGLYDVGPVGTPAYLDTEGEGMATALRSLAESRNLNLGAVIDAANRNELRALLEGEQPPPPPEPNADTGPATQHVRTDIDHNRTRLRFGLPIS